MTSDSTRATPLWHSGKYLGRKHDEIAPPTIEGGQTKTNDTNNYLNFDMNEDRSIVHIYNYRIYQWQSHKLWNGMSLMDFMYCILSVLFLMPPFSCSDFSNVIEHIIAGFSVELNLHIAVCWRSSVLSASLSEISLLTLLTKIVEYQDN